MSWSEGYVSEIDYTYGYYRELSPPLLALSMLSKRLIHAFEPPLRYLELGFGQGLSLNIHAASLEGEFWGTDFNPAHAAHAGELARISGANLKVLDDSFAELARRDLPEFHVIALHGIWSWISDENRQVIVDIARRRLAVGGILYISYNTSPGWSSGMPLRHLMTLHAELGSSEAQGITSRIDSAIAFAERLVANNALYFKANPAAADRLQKIKGQNRNYLAHEYFNADWHPMPFNEVAGMLAQGKLAFAASANLIDHVDAINLGPENQKLMGEIASPVLRESVRDYCVNQQFRRDIFVKGPRPLSAHAQIDLFRAQRFALLSDPREIPLKIRTPIGDVDLNKDVYKPVIAALAEDRLRAKSVSEMIALPGMKALNLPQVAQALIILTGAGHVAPAQDQAAVDRARSRATKLNAALEERAVASGDVATLASPVLGAGVQVGRLHQLFLRAIAAGARDADAYARAVQKLLHAQGERMRKDSKAIESEAEELAEIAAQAREFADKRLPLLQALGVA